MWNGTTYYYALNIQGDVVGIYDEEGNPVVTYNWDNAWGYNPIPEGVMASTLGMLNPLRYRGYVYDQETGYYYLQSRYYDPEIGRFINADAFTSTGQGLLGNNMYAYCRNNPVCRKDATGTWDVCTKDSSDDNNPFNDLSGAYHSGGGGGTGAIEAAAATALGAAVGVAAVLGTISPARQKQPIAVRKQEQELQIYIPLSKSVNKQYQYWEAYKVGSEVRTGKGLTTFEAALRVALGLNVMCANQMAAKWILILNGYFSAVGPEIHGEDGFYYHYHPNRYSHTHIWYYS